MKLAESKKEGKKEFSRKKITVATIKEKEKMKVLKGYHVCVDERERL